MNKILVKPYRTGHMIITKNMQAKQAVISLQEESISCVYITVNKDGYILYKSKNTRKEEGTDYAIYKNIKRIILSLQKRL